MTRRLRAGFELIEVRTGDKGMQKPYISGDGPAPAFTIESTRQELRELFIKLRGEEGRIVKENHIKLGAVFQAH